MTNDNDAKDPLQDPANQLAKKVQEAFVAAVPASHRPQFIREGAIFNIAHRYFDALVENNDVGKEAAAAIRKQHTDEPDVIRFLDLTDRMYGDGYRHFSGMLLAELVNEQRDSPSGRQ